MSGQWLRKLTPWRERPATEAASADKAAFIDGASAWHAISTDSARNWDRSRQRFDSFPIMLNHSPKFMLEAGSTTFCIGSCFARNIEEHLIYSGIAVSSRRMASRAGEWPGRPNGIVNKFTTPSMKNEIVWAANPPAIDESFFTPAGDGMFVDLQLAPGSKPVPLERAIERRRYLMTDYFARAFTADIIVITLGLDECWFDRETGIDLNGPPSVWTARAHPDRYAVRTLGFDETRGALDAMAAAIRARNPHARFLITVSPVPIAITFTSPDPVIATLRAKSMLRTVAEDFCASSSDADYFPSYEMVTMSPRSSAYQSDGRHVSEIAVAAIVERFIRAYLGREPSDRGDFVELPYLVANPDVEAALIAGEWESGYEHWLARGRAEGRPLWPDKPDRRMKKREMLTPPGAAAQMAES